MLFFFFRWIFIEKLWYCGVDCATKCRRSLFFKNFGSFFEFVVCENLGNKQTLRLYVKALIWGYNHFCHNKNYIYIYIDEVKCLQINCGRHKIRHVGTFLTSLEDGFVIKVFALNFSVKHLLHKLSTTNMIDYTDLHF